MISPWVSFFFFFPFPCWFCFCLEPQEPIAAEVTVPLGNETAVPRAAVTQAGLCACVGINL